MLIGSATSVRKVNGIDEFADAVLSLEDPCPRSSCAEAEAVTGAPLADFPTLLAWGEQDALFPRSEQDALRVVFRRSELRVYPETGHAPHWERPAEVAEDLIRFMRKNAE